MSKSKEECEVRLLSFSEDDDDFLLDSEVGNLTTGNMAHSVGPDVTFAGANRSPTRGGRGHEEHSPLLCPVEQEYGMFENNFPDDPQYQDIIRLAEDAIDEGILPTRIFQGSSGSYFVKNTDGVS